MAGPESSHGIVAKHSCHVSLCSQAVLTREYAIVKQDKFAFPHLLQDSGLKAKPDSKKKDPQITSPNSKHDYAFRRCTPAPLTGTNTYEGL